MSQVLSHPIDQADISRILRSRDTQRYFTGEGWTESPDHAQPFPNEAEAMRACASHELQNIELVLRVPSSGHEISATPVR